MTAYFDTSALVPLIIAEPSSATCARAWDTAHTITASSLAYVEVHTALAQAERQLRITGAQREQAATIFDEVWAQVTSVAPTDEIIHHAAQLGTEFALRGYDAVHCATALAAASDDFFAVSGDRALINAWNQLGVVTVEANQRVRNHD